jgi:hypothetical protein
MFYDRTILIFILLVMLLLVIIAIAFDYHGNNVPPSTLSNTKSLIPKFQL